MKIGLISDTHGLTAPWEKAMKLFEGADLIVHAGDILYHPPRLGYTDGYDIPDLADMMNACKIPLLIARGNCDSEVYEEILDTPSQSPYAFTVCGSMRIMVQHGHTFYTDYLESLSKKGRADILVSGHTHIPKIEKIGALVHVNPGSPSHPKWKNAESILTPTVGIISDGVISIVDLDSGLALMQHVL
ncbi:MAG: phosphodiesterase [Armatimonadota bacterium]